MYFAVLSNMDLEVIFKLTNKSVKSISFIAHETANSTTDLTDTNQFSRIRKSLITNNKSITDQS